MALARFRLPERVGLKGEDMMTLDRIIVGAVAAAVTLIGGVAQAQDFPSSR